MNSRLTVCALLVSLLFLVGGCSNDCQKLCKEMADYWDYCGVSYEDSQVADCKKNFKSKSDDLESYKTSCGQLIRMAENDEGERVIGLRARFTCEDMETGPGGAFAGGE